MQTVPEPESRSFSSRDLPPGSAADDRPAWQICGVYLSTVRTEEREGQESRLQAALDETGRTRGARVVATDRRVTVRMRIKADDELTAMVKADAIVAHAASRSTPGLIIELMAIRVRAAGATSVD